jgi:hypothetical protein
MTTTTDRVTWYAELVQVGLDTKILSETDVLAHATPAVLITALPRDVLATVFDQALSTGTMSPAALVRTMTPRVLAEHVPAAVLWAAIAAAAERAGIPAAKPAPDEAPSRELLRRALVAGLAAGVITPKDVVRHVDAKVLAHALPDALTQKLLEASLAAGKMNAELIIDTLGAAAIAAHAPTHIAWACLAAAAEPSAGGKLPAKQGLELIEEDDVASVLVELDDSAVLKPLLVDAKEATGKPTKNVVRRG